MGIFRLPYSLRWRVEKADLRSAKMSVQDVLQASFAL